MQAENVGEEAKARVIGGPINRWGGHLQLEGATMDASQGVAGGTGLDEDGKQDIRAALAKV